MLVERMRPLWEDHYEEIARFKDIPLNPDLSVYARADAGGTLRIFTCTLGDELCGYQVFFVAPNPHYKESLQAVQDILFLDATVRQGLTGYKFIKWCDEQLKADGIQIVFQHVKLSNDFSPILKRLGYEEHEKVLSRRLN
jgi:hypothetical protein